MTRYTTTSDDVRIAYWEIGRGPPLIQLGGLPYGHIGFEWEMPDLRRCYELLAIRRALYRFDSRGQGLSERDVSDFELATLARDLDAVVDVAGAPASILAAINAAPVAIHYAANSPDKVSHLLLWCPLAQGALNLENRQLDIMRHILRTDFELYSKTVAHAFLSWDEGEASQQFAEYIRASTDAATALRFFEALHTYDVLDLLPRVQCPTLVMHRPAFPFSQPGVVEDIAARIPDCKLALFEGNSGVPYLGDWRAVARTIYGFLGETNESVREAMGGRRVLTLLRRGREGLSGREQEVINLVARGFTNREIAEELFLAEKTVENHVGRILDKLDLRSRTTLAAYAVEHGIARSA